MSPSSIQPWVDVVSLHPDVLSENFSEDIFALDLGPLADGNPNVPAVYRDPEHFFRASYLTSGLRSLLQDVLRFRYEPRASPTSPSLMQISVRGVTKRFGALEAVSGVRLDIADGELFTLLGPSGCGKTTLLRLIAGFYHPAAGIVGFDGREMNAVPPHERHIGMVFQNYALWPHMTVWNNIAYGLKIKRLPRAEIVARIQEVLRKVNLEGLDGRYPGQLSGGQQQRVALAHALILNPDILLLDEVPIKSATNRVRGRSYSSFGRPTWRTSPRSMTAIRSDSERASS